MLDFGTADFYSSFWPLYVKKKHKWLLEIKLHIPRGSMETLLPAMDFD